jgi:LysM repeat protein
MLVRAVQRVPLIRAVVLAAFSAVIPGTIVVAQEPAGQMPATHTVKRGDTLWDIARTYLGDPFLWPEIYRLNTEVIEDPHWIYPGELLKLPGATARVVAVTPPVTEPTPTPQTPVRPNPTAVPITEVASPPGPASTVRVGEYTASPWVDLRGGPSGSGYIIQSGDLPGIASHDRSRFQLHDRVVIAPPVGAVAPERELYLAYKLGPYIEDFGQIVIPTGMVEVTRAPRNGEAAVARVVRMFGEMAQGHRLIAYDSSAALATGTPQPVSGGAAPTGKIRWISNMPVLPSLQSYVVVDMSRREGLATGDQIEFYHPRTPPTETQSLAMPEISIARAQVLRVTPYGAAAIIVSQEQPKIEQGTAARIAAKMP